MQMDLYEICLAKYIGIKIVSTDTLLKYIGEKICR